MNPNPKILAARRRAAATGDLSRHTPDVLAALSDLAFRDVVSGHLAEQDPARVTPEAIEAWEGVWVALTSFQVIARAIRALEYMVSNADQAIAIRDTRVTGLRNAAAAAQPGSAKTAAEVELLEYERIYPGFQERTRRFQTLAANRLRLARDRTDGLVPSGEFQGTAGERNRANHAALHALIVAIRAHQEADDPDSADDALYAALDDLTVATEQGDLDAADWATLATSLAALPIAS